MEWYEVSVKKDYCKALNLRRNSTANASYMNDEVVVAEQPRFEPRGRFT